MAEYIDKNKIPWVKTDNPKGKYWDRIVLESTIKEMTPAEVVERSKIEKAIEEIDFLRQHRAKYITEDNKICIDSGEVLKILGI